ncbi:MAG: LEA14-like dessication related protein [Bacteroidia bacterium]|jgi:LEA14-like dessication related protein
MKFPLLLLFTSLIFIGCSTPKAPDFKTIKNARVAKVNGNIYSVAADAVYHNPNGIGGSLTGMEMDIFVDKTKVTHLSQTKSAVIQPETDFIVPIKFDVDINKVLGEQKGGLQGLLGKLLKDELEVQYKGYLKVEFLSQELKVPVDFTEAISVGVQFD